jgi:uncharacterized protein (TIGR03083 family)
MSTSQAATHNARTTPDAAHAIREAIDRLPSDAPTACEGWTAHHLVAHLAAGSKEIADLIDERLDGRPPRATRGFEEREAPMRQLRHDELIERLSAESKRKLNAYSALADLDDPAITFTGTRMSAQELETHSRSEVSLHRWDLVGDDDISTALLGDPELTVHAIKVLNRMPTLNESSTAMATRVGTQTLRIVLRSPAQPDVVLTAAHGRAHLELAEAGTHDAITVTTDQANRLLLLWGRTSSERTINVHAATDALGSLSTILWPHAQSWPPNKLHP